MKSTVAKMAATGAIALVTLGIGAGVASADPIEGQQQGPQVQPQPQPQVAGDGFWFVGSWIPLPSLGS